MTQQRKETLLPADDAPGDKELTFKYRSGCTLIIDPEEGRITYSISKTPTSDNRLRRQRRFFEEGVADEEELAVERFGLQSKYRSSRARLEPLAGLHAESEMRGGY